MDRKFDVDRNDLDDDFEATHRDLEAYVRGGEAINAGLERLRWERKVMRRFKKLEQRMETVEAGQHDTTEIAIIAQREIGPARKFVDAVLRWRRIITKYTVIAAITVIVGKLLTKYGVKP